MLLFLFYHVKLSWYIFVKCMYCMHIPPGIVSITVEDPWTEAERRYDLPYYTTCKESFFLFDLSSIWTGFLCVFLVFFCSLVCLRFHQRFS
jgi:hypothetical protein